MQLSRVFLQLIFAGVYCAAVGQQSDAKSAYDKGVQYQDENRLDSAVIFFEKSRDLYAAKGDHLEEARSISRLGDIYKYYTYNFDKAEKQYELALSTYTSYHPEEEFRITRCYYNLAATNRSQRDYKTSVTWCQKAIDGCIKLKDDGFLERAYSIMGNIYRDMQLYDSAISYYEKGVEVNRKINKGRPNETLAGFYSGWGDAFFRQGAFGSAKLKLKDAIRIYDQLVEKDQQMYFHALKLAGDVSRPYSFSDAFYYLDRADQVRKALNQERGGLASGLWTSYGDMFRAVSDPKASKYYQMALQATTSEPLGRDGNPTNIDKVEFKGFAYDALLRKGQLLIKHDSITWGVECYKVAEKLMIAGRRELDTEDAKWNMVDANYDLYENALSALYTTNDLETVLHFMENSKSQSLANAFQEAELKKVLGSNDTLFTDLRDLRKQSLSLQHRIDQNNDTSARDQLLAVARDISSLESTINDRYPFYLKTKFESPGVSLTALKEKARRLDATFIEYFWGSKYIFAFVVSGDSAAFYDLGLPFDLEQHLSDFTKRTNNFSPEAVNAFADQSHKIYKAIVKPFSSLLQHKRIIIVPDGPLSQLPFETLVESPGGQSFRELPYLINKFIISYAFSGYYLAREPNNPSSNPRLLAFGFTGGSDVRSASDDAVSIQIPGSEAELNALSEKFPDGSYLYGADVTERKFKEQAGNFDLLHLAVHGSGDPTEDYSATLYFRDADGYEDGRLYWYELYGMNLRASLAVLSACESGIGKTYRGEGMLSMANAFTFAGCSSVVMGLWKVDDQVSVRLMDTFYGELLNGMAIDEALAMAKRTYLASADQVTANPKLWSSLVAYGEAPVVKANQLRTEWFVLAVVVLIGAVVLLYVKTKKK